MNRRDFLYAGAAGLSLATIGPMPPPPTRRRASA